MAKSWNEMNEGVLVVVKMSLLGVRIIVWGKLSPNEKVMDGEGYL